jgi:demethylmenaquinone methyltransferase/2-methoxy-6-polyprenyl-1,4-benzoquinol methylase
VEEKTHFGYQTIAKSQKTKRVSEVFHSVASEYDLMNDLMSFGLHRWWKQFAITRAQIRPTDTVLDLAGGTGDLTIEITKRLNEKGQVVLADINAAMLAKSRERLLNQGILKPVSWLQTNAEALPFSNQSFDKIVMAFGLRNVTDKERALKEMARLLKPGGRCVILEFSKVTHKPLSRLYDLYSFSILPKLGKWIANDADSYQYLAESIRMHPDQETLKNMMLAAGFDKCEYQNVQGGIVAVHVGFSSR